MGYQETKAFINANIKQNGENEITGSILNTALNDVLDSGHDEVNQLGQELNGLFTSYNLIDKWYDNKQYNEDNGYFDSEGYCATYPIRVEPETTYILSDNGNAATFRVVDFLNENGSVARELSSVSGSFTTASNEYYLIITYSNVINKPQLEKGNTITPYRKYNPYLRTEHAPFIDTEHLLPKCVTEDKLEVFELLSSKNLLNPSLLVTGKWINVSGGTSNVSSAYGYYDYIEIKPSQAYHLSNNLNQSLCSRSDAYIAFYDESKQFITSSSVASNVKDITTPSTAKYVRVSVNIDRLTEAQMEEGETRTSYEAYFTPYLVLKGQYINVPDNSVGENAIKSSSVSQVKLATDAKKNIFSGWRNSGEIAPGGFLYTELVYITKNTLLSAEINGSITSAWVGIAHGGADGKCVEITPDNLVIRGGSDNGVISTNPHGLTLGNKTTLLIQKDITLTATISLFDDYGNSFVLQNIDWATVGKPYLANKNSSGTIDANLAFIARDIKQDIWMFGDSYMNIYMNTRWPYYMMSWGYTSNLIDARGGEDASEALQDFITLLALGYKPIYALWCMGMNHGTDVNNAVNSDWLRDTTSFLTLCSQYSIIPILATIPSVPALVHAKLNDWVRSSGYRYIDFAASVEDEQSYYWRGWGTNNALLYTDEVHPTVKGGKELALRVLIDFPEISIVK